MDSPVLSSLLPVMLLIAIGFVAGKAGWMRAQASPDLSNLVFMVLLTLATVVLELAVAREQTARGSSRRSLMRTVLTAVRHGIVHPVPLPIMLAVWPGRRAAGGDDCGGFAADRRQCLHVFATL